MSAEQALQPPVITPSVRPGVVAIALAILLPLATLAIPLAWWARPDPEASLAPVAAGMEKSLANDPEVVLLGASKVYTDLDQAALAGALASSPDEVKPLNLSGTTAPVWYAVLKNRVYGTGKKPKLILVYSTFDWALAARPSGETERAVLLAQMGSDEEVLRRKSLGAGAGGAMWDRVRRRRTESHAAMMGLVRDAAVGFTLATPGAAPAGEGRVAAGAALAAPALDALFGMEAGLDLSAANRAIPIVEEARKQAAASTRLEDTLLPDFLEMAAAHDAKIVFIHAPVRLSSEFGFQVEPQLMRDAVQAINDAGAGYVDLRELRLGDAAFGDAAHLNRVGRDTLTRALIERLLAMGVGGDGPIAAARLPVVTTPPRVARVGTPPVFPAVVPKRGPRACGWEAPIPELRPINDFALQAAGLGMVSPLVLLEDGVPMKAHATRDEFDDACTGAFLHQERGAKFSPTGSDPAAASARTYTFALSPDAPMRTEQGFEAWWVYPGTSLTFDFDAAEEPAADRRIVVDAVVFGAGTGAATARVGDGPEVPLAGVGLHRTATLVSPTPAGSPPSGPWRLTISAPADGGWVLLRRVVYGTAEDPRFVVGAPGGSSVGIVTADVAYAAPPQPLGPLGVATPGAGGTATYDLGAMGVPDTRALWQLASVSGCSPVRVLEDGTPLPSPVVRAEEVTKGPGRFAQVGTLLTVTGSDATAPGANGRAYTARLDESRRCRGLRWLYPGDTATFTVKPASLSPLLADATRVEIGGAAIVASNAPPAATVGASMGSVGATGGTEPGSGPQGTLRIHVGDTVYLDARFPLADLATTPPAWTIDPPLPRGTEPIVLELAIPPDAPYTLFTSLALSEPGVIPFSSSVPAPTPEPAP
ncbi:MAG: hypothetical protein Q8P18_01450 [Pseudomonadota bacterium]|nr:hypothetical protein [Pseudomonadota bacterium]